MDRKLAFTSWGQLAEDPRGLHVTITYQGRDLLGTVVDVEHNDVLGMTLLVVRHFNGEPWPVKPHVAAVRALVREYESGDGDGA